MHFSNQRIHCAVEMMKTPFTEIEETKTEITDEEGDTPDGDMDKAKEEIQPPDSPNQEEQDPSAVHALSKPISTVLHGQRRSEIDLSWIIESICDISVLYRCFETGDGIGCFLLQ